ncbi:hypothetical protein ACMFMG_005737 [Clarireedia jacksonii]
MENWSTFTNVPGMFYDLSGSKMTLQLFALLAGCLLLLSWASRSKASSKEPPIISSKIPLIGHMLGLMKYKLAYYTMLTNKYHHEVFTLPMFGGSLYIVTAPRLVGPIHRYYKDLSLWSVEATFTVKLGALGNHSAQLLAENPAGRMEGSSLVMDGMRHTHISMGAGLNQMNQVAVDIIGAAIDQLESESPTELDLWKWIDHNVSLMTSGAVYGPMNPYKDSEVASGLRDYSADSTMLLFGLFGGILAPKGYAGRERIVSAFKKYFAAGGHSLGSELVKARFRSLTAYGISPEDIARFETVNGFGILINTLPTAFWSLFHTLSDSKLLSIVRELVLPLLSKSVDESARLIYTLDIRHIRETPILVSIVHESLRYHTSGAAPRMVMEDFMLDNKYLLKKGSMLLIPNREIHFNEEAWGQTVNQFDAFRFSGDDTRTSKKPPPSAFRGFGSGVNLCPGKNFATTEILAILAIMVLRFDIEPVSDSWENPGDNGDNMSTVVCIPKRPVLVKIKPRKEYAGGTWKIKAMER